MSERGLDRVGVGGARGGVGGRADLIMDSGIAGMLDTLDPQ